MKNKTETLGNEMSKPGLEGGGGGLGVKVEKQPPSPRSPPPSPPRNAAGGGGGGVLRAPTPPSAQKIKCESPSVPLHAPSPRPVSSPPDSGPGAEVKGKPGTPIPSGCVKGALPRPGSASGCPGQNDDASKAASGPLGGRLTFFKEGRFVLELSHRTEMGAPAGWVAVKSKTYWPPPSYATTTTTQHPLRHDTPTSQSDDCSSLNSSPWTSEHVRKQSAPRRSKSVQSHFFQVQLEEKGKRKRNKKFRRNPFVYPVGSWDSSEIHQQTSSKAKLDSRSKSVEVKRANLENKVQCLEDKIGLKVDPKVSNAKTLFEKPPVSASAESIDPTFVSPRKRYLRQMEDQDSIHRKKLHSLGNSLSSQVSGERPSSSSSPAQSFPNRSAINSQTPISSSSSSSSAYSIDSILNNETANRKSESFLRTLLKPEPKLSVPHPKTVAKERINSEVVSNTVKVERPERPERAAPERLEQLTSAHSKDRKDAISDLGRFAAYGGYGSLGSLASLYGLNPLDPRYMMIPTLIPPMSSQQTEIAVAAAAAALSGYPLNPLHSYQHLFPGASLPHGYPPTTTFAPLLRPQQPPSRSSPHPMAHSPSPKPSQSSSTPASPHLSSRGASPRGATSPWQPPPPAHPFSPQKPLSSPPSPPQDAPLNLSKPRNHVDK